MNGRSRTHPRTPHRLAAALLLFAALSSARAAAPAAAAPLPAPIVFAPDTLLLDLRDAPWEYLARDPQPASRVGFSRPRADLERDAQVARTECGPILQEEGWRPIRLGRRWENAGHPELNDKATWLRLRFILPAGMPGWRIGFFCTAVDDSVDLFCNGTHIARRQYHWGTRVHEPVDVDLSAHARPGAVNLLVLRIHDSAQARGGGVLGHVRLYRTLPFTRTARGGILPGVDPADAGPFSVVVHLGDALLARQGRAAFTRAELRAMDIPPYILREDELVLVAPAALGARSAGPHRVNLDEVASMHDDRPLALRCQGPPARVGLYEQLALAVELEAAYDNPFDPRQINLCALIETPSGRTETVPGFFRQDFDSVAIGESEEILLPRRAAPWRVYYRPRELGPHKFHLIAQDATGACRTPDRTFEVVPSGRRGFLRVSKVDARFFEYDNGESYFGIGPSGWYRDPNYIFGGNTRHVSTRRLDDYYRRKAAGGSNYDYCLAEFFGRLYTRGGVIDQHVAWKCEHRLRTLESLGIHWVTCYDDLCRSVIYGLDTVPYAIAQGGPCRTVEQLYVNERALEMQRDHLRYFVARMSDSPALLVWAVGDEGQAGTRFSRSMVRAWIKALQSYVRAIDVYQHPHVMCEGPRSIAEGGDAIIIPDWYFRRDIDAVALSLDLMKTYGEFNCPLINPEGGMVEWTKPEDALGPRRALYYLTGERWRSGEAISFHNHLWISLFLKCAVGGTEWLGAFIVQRNEMHHAAALAAFLKGESLTRPHWDIVTPAVSHPDLRGFCLCSADQTLVWVQNRFHNWLEAGHQGKAPPTIAGATIDVPVRRPGAHRIELWNTRTGRIVTTTKSKAATCTVRFALPPIDKDVALKIRRERQIDPSSPAPDTAAP